MYIDIGQAKYTPKDRLMELEDGEGGEEGDTDDDDEGEGDSVRARNLCAAKIYSCETCTCYPAVSLFHWVTSLR